MKVLQELSSCDKGDEAETAVPVTMEMLPQWRSCSDESPATVGVLQHWRSCNTGGLQLR